MSNPIPFLMDAEADIEPGDYLRSERGSWYRVHTSRDVRRRDPLARRRQRLTVTRLIPPPTSIDDDARVHEFGYARRRGRR